MALKILILIFASILMLANVDSGISRTTLAPCSIDDHNTSSNSFSWQHIGPGKRLPNNAVLGGQNIDASPLFVARGTGQYRHLYGKIAIPLSDNAGLVENQREIATPEFEVLTAKSYVWCYPNEVSSNAKVVNPVCRSTHQRYLCIGQLAGSQCGLPWGGGVVYYSDYEVLVIGTKC